ncbi:unnamed protein product [Strongylus vulgaris]|uniref:Uncharacterized protein n=1 Tax=Strongylus vulgaris TaxID=40348 RepID=A0A3P7I8N1_STRVU|nr:unnamed protein product [Strongylus vulgaris]
MMVYAGVLNKTLPFNANIKDGLYLFNRTKGTYPGALGDVTEAWDGSRIPYFILTGVGDTAEPKRLIVIQLDVDVNVTLIPLYGQQNEKSFVFNGRPLPLTVPACGFTGSGCPISFFDAYRGYVIAAICIAALLILAVVVVIIVALK